MASSGDPKLGHSAEGGFANRGWQNSQKPGYSPNEQEMRVLRECQQESFWNRSLPLGLLAGTGTLLLIQRGIFTAKTRFGPFPKIFFAGICGHLLGKISYVSACKAKFLALENSPIADMIRKGTSPGAIAAQFGRPGMETGFSSGGDADAMFTGGGGKHHGDDYHSEDASNDTSLDQDISMENYDNSGVGDVAFQGGPDEKKKPEMTMTYDQLRKQNRETTAQPHQYREMLPGQSPPKSSQSTPQSVPASSRSSSDEGFTLGRSSKLRKNAYGDLISDE